MPPLVLERLDLGQTPGNRRGTQFRPGGAALNRNADLIEAAINALSGLNLVGGTITKLPPGSNPTFSITGTPPNLFLNMGVVDGDAGAGAPNSADILAIGEKDRLERSLAAAGVPDEPSLILDFVRGVHFASKTAIAATNLTLVTALGGISAVSRASPATHIGSDGLLKTAATNTLRVEYDPVTRERVGSLIETIARTNLATYSEQLSHASYGKGGVAIVDDFAADPFGLVAADKIVEDASTGQHLLTKSVSVTAGTIHTWSPCFKADERYIVRLQFDDGLSTTHAAATFNLVTGAVTDVLGPYQPTLERFANGYWRTELIGLPTTTTARLVAYLGDGTGSFSYTGDGTSGLEGWGFQCEPGARKSSYIQTAGSAVTRAADSGILLAGGQWLPANGPWSGMVECRLSEQRGAGTVSEILNLRSADNTSMVRVREGIVLPGADLYTVSGGTPRLDLGGYATTTGSVMRFAFSLSGTSFAFAKDNVLSAGNTGGASVQPTGLDRAFIGVAGFMGHIRRIILYPQGLSNAKVQALSNQAAWS